MAPVDHPEALKVATDPTMRCWRWKGAGNIDEYQMEYEVPIRVETFMAMQLAAESRLAWDAQTKSCNMLRVGGPSDPALKAVHGFDGDHMVLNWLLHAPFPLKDREFVIHRRLAQLSSADDPERSTTCEPEA